MLGKALIPARRRVWPAAFALLVWLCLSAAVAGPARAESPHVAATMDTSSCAACHTPHSADNALLLRAGVDADNVSASCEACHDGSSSQAANVTSGTADSFGGASGHSLVAEVPGGVRMNGCSTCHDVHGDSENVRMIPAAQINGTAVSSAGTQACIACHASDTDWYGAGYPSTSAPLRDDAGYPVAGTWTGPSTYDSTSSAHSLIPERTVPVTGSNEPVVREPGSCLNCHSAHGSRNAYDGLPTTYTVPAQATLDSDQAQGSYAALCFNCHAAEKPSGVPTATADILQFATGTGAGSAGHSVVTSGGILPVGAPLPCFECHNPHGSQRGNVSLVSDERGGSLDTSTPAGARAFCFTCHTTADTTAGWDSDTATYVLVGDTDMVVGLSRDGGLLHLSATEGHDEDDAASCYECHGASYEPGGRNVHDPGDGTLADLSAASLPATDTSLVTTPSVDASGSPDASASADGSASTDASVSADASGSLEPSATAETTIDPLAPLGVPSLPSEIPLVLGSAGARLTRRRLKR